MALVVKDDSFIEVHQYYAGSTIGAAVVALFLQGFLPKYIPHAGILEFPLLVTIYFSLGRRNAASGIFLGAGIGLVQDAISHLPLGVYGIALTTVAYAAQWIGYRINVDVPLSRFALTFVLYDLERLIIEVIERYLLNQPGSLWNLAWLIGSLLAAAFAVLIFPQLDRLRKA
ncbi:MAG TPA: rod shape-determining protein MreD [Patescibacteria group bacterium]|nr:rod shape-determining protein MreD [Patescibacteria group bacterium]